MKKMTPSHGAALDVRSVLPSRLPDPVLTTTLLFVSPSSAAPKVTEVLSEVATVPVGAPEDMMFDVQASEVTRRRR